MFSGEGYHYWKTRMQIFKEAIDLKIWEAIELHPFIPTMVERNATIKKTQENKISHNKRFPRRRYSHKPSTSKEIENPKQKLK